ncbi:MAG: hypothetical protein Q4G49_03030 [Paracoccus sp. (in: a-proteobacteria)]|nr:hypothetical protein [Paracoccus sp. (in: a-proteobacteria)]
MRLYDWEARLSDYICRVAKTPFEYGVHDCALFAAGGVEAVTGSNPAVKWAGRYGCALGGLRQMRRVGYADHIDCAARLFPAISAAARMAGDLAVVTQGDDRALGIVQGALIYVLLGDQIGLVPAHRASQILGVR